MCAYPGPNFTIRQVLTDWAYTGIHGGTVSPRKAFIYGTFISLTPQQGNKKKEKHTYIYTHLYF